MKSSASAPGKVILFGEHFVVYGIKAILASIDKRVTVTSETSDDDKIIVKSSLGTAVIDSEKSLKEVKSSFKPFVYLAKKLMEENDYKGGITVLINSDIPSGVGLGSSSACCVAAAGSIAGLFGEYSRDQILKLAIEAEKTIFKETSGADTTVCTYGGIIEYDKQSGFKKIETKPEFYLVIANSKQTHSTNKVVSKVNRLKKENEKLFSLLCDKETSLIESVDEYLKNNDLKELGESMTENQDYLEQIGVSNDKLNSMIKIAQQSSYGAKLTGAGGGGCIIALTDQSNLENTLEGLKKENYECFSVKIDSTGLDTF